mgnify:FL=1
MKRRSVLSLAAGAVLASGAGIARAEGRTVPLNDVPVHQIPANPATREEQLKHLFEDMSRKNDYAWGSNRAQTGPGQLIMGNNPKGTNTPQWWYENLVHQDYHSDKLWQAISPWMTAVTHHDASVSNVRVQMSKYILNILHRSDNTWHTVVVKPVEGSYWEGTDLGGKAKDDAKAIPSEDGLYTSVNVKVGETFHGWTGSFTYDTGDILAMHAKMAARLVVADSAKPDNLDKARVQLQMGVDYYPHLGVLVDDPRLELTEGKPYFPGVGVSRAKMITRNWGTYQFATVYATNAETGGVDGDPGGGLTEQQFRDNPPPL